VIKVTDEDPIRQLQSLLDDPSRLLERISRIQSVIGSVGESAQTATRAETAIAASEKPVDGDPAPFETLRRMLRDMQAQIDERVRPLALQAIGAETERLHQLSEQEQIAMGECLARIDRSLLDCVSRIDESRKICADLAALNQRLRELGASPESLPDFSAVQSASEILHTRIEKLHRQGKL
jgi:hypothetical protein